VPLGGVSCGGGISRSATGDEIDRSALAPPGRAADAAGAGLPAEAEAWAPVEAAFADGSRRWGSHGLTSGAVAWRAASRRAAASETV
jgi:hypothetical protein